MIDIVNYFRGWYLSLSPDDFLFVLLVGAVVGLLFAFAGIGERRRKGGKE